MTTRRKTTRTPSKVAKTYSLDTTVVAELEELAAADHRSVSNMLEVIVRRGAQ